MIPTRLAKLDNTPGFLISIAHSSWYIGQPLPGDVVSFTDGLWVYGQYYICVVQLSDGHYHVYQSRDNGYSWVDVLDFGSEVFGCMVRPNYGRALICTSTGWWESDNSGTSWSKLTSQAPGCFCAKEINNDIIVAMSRRNVWKSVDAGATWVSIYSSSKNMIYPALAGTTYDLLIGVGSSLLYSDNLGGSWHEINGMLAGGWNPYTGQLWRSEELDTWKGLVITDIELTSLSGGYGYTGPTPTFVIQVQLSDGVLRHYFANRYTQSLDFVLIIKAVFDAVKSQSDSLTSYIEMTTGTNSIVGRVAFSGKTLDNKPLLLISNDFGQTWINQRVENATIYDGPDLSQLSSVNNPFTEDVYLKATFEHGICHNGWSQKSTGFRRFQSFDADILFRERMFGIEYPGGFTSVLSQATSFDADYITQKILTESMLLDFVSMKEMSSAFIGKYISMDTFECGIDDDLVVVTRRYLGSDYDMLAQHVKNAPYGHRAYVRGTCEYGSGSNIVLAQTHFPEIYVEAERAFPQQWDIPSFGRESKLPYKRGVMDTTRKEEE